MKKVTKYGIIIKKRWYRMAKTINVINEKITRLQYEAQGFRNAFFILYDSIMNRQGSEAWGGDGDGMSVLGTNGCFSVELYLKFLLVEASFSHTTISGTHIATHDLYLLYDALDKSATTYVADLEKEYSKIKYKDSYPTLKDFLKGIREYFIEWRYAYDKGVLNINLNTLSDVLNFMEKYSMAKFSPIADVLANNPPSTVDAQTMTLSSPDDIEKL